MSQHKLRIQQFMRYAIIVTFHHIVALCCCDKHQGSNQVSISDLDDPLTNLLRVIPSLNKVKACAEAYILGMTVLGYIAARAKGKFVDAGYILAKQQSQ